MQESLKILLDGTGCTSAINISSIDSDNFTFEKAKKIKDHKKKEEFLLEFINSSPTEYYVSRLYYIDLIKKSNSSYAYDLAYSMHKRLVKNPLVHKAIAEIAIENEAWTFAKKELETALWLSLDDKGCIKIIQKLLKKVSNKISSGETDNSNSNYWKTKEIDIIEILSSMLHSLEGIELFTYSIALLKTFPDNIENLEKVCEVLGLKGDPEILVLFEEYLNNTNIPVAEKDLHLGFINYELLNCNKSLDLLSKAKETKSNYPKALFYIAANYLLMHDIPNFKTTFHKLIEPYITNISLREISSSSSPGFTAMLMLWSIYTDTDIEKNWEFQNQSLISKELSRLIKKFIGKWTSDELDDLIKKLIENNFLKLLPLFTVYLCEIFIRRKSLGFAKKVLNFISNNQVHRLKAWIYRIENNLQEAEKELAKYRAGIDFSNEPAVTFESLKINYPKESVNNEEDILSSIKDIYKQTENLTKELQLEYGINNNTCEENSCADCCKKTFPAISYSEYLYIKKWLDTQPKSYQDEIKQKSTEIVNQYMKTYKTEFPFVTTDETINTKLIEYPKGYTFTCPFLQENRCTAYEARPFMCRAYGYSTIDGVSFKGCKYYINQFLYASTATNIRKAINFNLFNNFIKKADNKLIETTTVAPIPLWFAYVHKEAKIRAKYNFLGTGPFSFIYKLIIKIAFKKVRDF